MKFLVVTPPYIYHKEGSVTDYEGVMEEEEKLDEEGLILIQDQNTKVQ